MKFKCEISLAKRIANSFPVSVLAIFRSMAVLLLLLLAAHSALAQSVTGLYSFTGRDDGANPEAGLVHAADGNLYGVATLGGTEDEGSFFRLTSSGTTTTVYSFCPESSSCPSGREPGYALTQGTDLGDA